MKRRVMNNSRKESDFVKRMSPQKREYYLKRFMAACNPESLVPYIEIVKHDKHYREIEYMINVDQLEKQNNRYKQAIEEAREQLEIGEFTFADVVLEKALKEGAGE